MVARLIRIAVFIAFFRIKRIIKFVLKLSEISQVQNRIPAALSQLIQTEVFMLTKLEEIMQGKKFFFMTI